MASPMEKEIIYMLAIEESIRETGRMEKKKDLETSSSTTNTAILVNGEITRKMGKANTSIPTAKDMKEAGSETRKMVEVFIATRTRTFTKETGKMIEGKDKEQ